MGKRAKELDSIEKIQWKSFQRTAKKSGDISPSWFFLRTWQRKFLRTALAVDDEMNVLRQVFRNLGHNVSFQEGNKSTAMG